MPRAALGAAMSVAVLSLAARTSVAQVEPVEVVWLTFEAMPQAGCPSEQQFQVEVSKLTGRARFTKAAGARRIRVELEARGAEVVGRFISGASENPSSREVRGKDCQEVASALAIAVALTIDPDALGLPEAATDTTGPTEPPRGSPDASVASSRPPAAKQAPAPAPGLRFGVGIAMVLETAWAPELRGGGGVAVLVGLGRGFTVTAGATRFPMAEQNALSFGGWLGHGSLAWDIVKLGPARPLLLASYEAGVVESAGSGLALPVEARRSWQAFGLALGLRLESSSAFLELSAGPLMPLYRQRYLTTDTVGRLATAHEVPNFGFKQETRLGVFL